MKPCGGICETVDRLVTAYGTRDPAELCEAAGVLLVPEPMGSQENAIKGFYLRICGIGTVVINADLPEAVSRFVLAHELGHACLHAREQAAHFLEVGLFGETGQLETEANLFAAELLLEDGAVLDRLREGADFFTVAAEQYVPPELLEYKLRLLRGKGYDLPESPIIARGNFLSRTFPPDDGGYGC